MTDDRARDAIEHLQGAALQLIQAFRAVLDVAEDIVRDPSDLVAAVRDAASAAAPDPEPPTSPGPAPRVTRIQVS